MARILVTGAAGFIGSHVSHRLLERGDVVVGLDNLNAYYDVDLKKARLARLAEFADFEHACISLEDVDAVAALFASFRPERVINLAAQAGVRYSLENPLAYVTSNVLGFLNILEGCRSIGVDNLVFASTSSVFGANGALPQSVRQGAAHPLTLYAATKLANEDMAHSYAHLFGFPCTGLRFFTVYGPWGRPDMALFRFTKAILSDQPIDLYGQGMMQRDFTYIDDIASGVIAALDRPAAIDPAWDSLNPNPSTSGVAPWRILNIGNSQPVELMRYVEVLEEKLGRKARINHMDMQPGDVRRTAADITETIAALDYAPTTSVEAGVGRFVDWYLDYYR